MSDDDLIWHTTRKTVTKRTTSNGAGVGGPMTGSSIAVPGVGSGILKPQQSNKFRFLATNPADSKHDLMWLGLQCTSVAVDLHSYCLDVTFEQPEMSQSGTFLKDLTTHGLDFTLTGLDDQDAKTYEILFSTCSSTAHTFHLDYQASMPLIHVVKYDFASYTIVP